MVIFLTHPEHGEKVASAEEEAVYDESNGWKRFEPSSTLAPIPTEEGIDFLRAEWAAKFGKKPHHKKSIETLIKELEQ